MKTIKQGSRKQRRERTNWMCERGELGAVCVVLYIRVILCARRDAAPVLMLSGWRSVPPVNVCGSRAVA